MITTNVVDVLQDGTITKMDLSVNDLVTVSLERFEPNELFTVISFDAKTYDAVAIKQSLLAVRRVLFENGMDYLIVPSIDGGHSTRVSL